MTTDVRQQGERARAAARLVAQASTAAKDAALHAAADLLVERTGEVLAANATDVERATQTTDEHLTEIMMAQDFHDLTGQVIARVVTLAGNIEQQLVQLVIETAPPHAIPAPPEPKREHPAGPVVDPENNPDVVTDQSQVDDLLASLGF